MTADRADSPAALAAALATEAAQAAQHFTAKSPSGAEVAALASIALSLVRIADALGSRVD